MALNPTTQDRLTVFYDERVLDHDTGAGFFEAKRSELLPIAEIHPENADRIRNIHGVLRNGPLGGVIDWHGADPASDPQLQRFHEPEYLTAIEAELAQGEWWPTTTTRFTATSLEPARVAAGLAVAAARHVWSGAGPIAYALCRPPGHHAQPTAADGYCLFNNIGVAIQELRAHGLRRTAVIDWDVHHGNGTQEGFYSDPDVLTVSIHMDHGAWGPTHPQTGGADEVGAGPGAGTNVNVPLPYGAGDATYLRVFEEIVVPAVEAAEPEMIFIANGQDANQFDPNGRQNVTMNGFHQLGLRTRELAADLCDGRIVAVQEGGYALSYTAFCAHASLAGLLGRDVELDDPIAFLPDHVGDPDALVERLRSERNLALGR